MARQDKITDLRGNGQNAGGDQWEARLAERNRGRLTWADAGAEDLLAAVASVTEGGAALLLSKTSDGGALVIHLLVGTVRHKLYPASVAELNEALALIAQDA